MNTRKNKGWIQIAPYRYAVPLKKQWTVYEGMWSDRGENCIAGLEVIRDNSTQNKPVRFNTLDEAIHRYGN